MHKPSSKSEILLDLIFRIAESGRLRRQSIGSTKTKKTVVLKLTLRLLPDTPEKEKHLKERERVEKLGCSQKKESQHSPSTPCMTRYLSRKKIHLRSHCFVTLNPLVNSQIFGSIPDKSRALIALG